VLVLNHLSELADPGSCRPRPRGSLLALAGVRDTGGAPLLAPGDLTSCSPGSRPVPLLSREAAQAARPPPPHRTVDASRLRTTATESRPEAARLGSRRAGEFVRLCGHSQNGARGLQAATGQGRPGLRLAACLSACARCQSGIDGPAVEKWAGLLGR
jgi:hypothetical protein